MSKSVTLNTSDASTGRKKKTKIRRSAGARKNHAALPTSDGMRVRAPSGGMVALRWPRSFAFHLGQQVSPFLEHRVHVLIERRQSLILTLGPPNRLLAVLVDRGRDLLPLWNLRQRHHSLQLIAERPRVLVVRERRILPRRLPRRQIAGENVKLQLYCGPRHVLHQQPRLLLVLRRSEERKTRSERQRHSRPVEAGHRRRHPLLLRSRVETILEFADVPGAGDIHRDVAALELLEEVGHLRARYG